MGPSASWQGHSALVCDGELSGSATACTGLQDLASSWHPDVLHPDRSGYNSPASLFLLPVSLLLKKCYCSPDWCCPSFRGHRQRARTLPAYLWVAMGAACTNTFLANHPASWQRSGASPGFSNSSLHAAALLPCLSTFAFITTQQKMTDQKNHRNLMAGIG